MEAAGLSENVGAGTKVEMVGIAQDDARLYIVAQFAHVDAFHGAAGAYGHENRGGNRAVVGGDYSGARIGGWRSGFNDEFHMGKVTNFVANHLARRSLFGIGPYAFRQ